VSAPLANGTLVHLDDRYWAEPEGGRAAVIRDYLPTSNLYMVQPIEDGVLVKHTCSRPASMLSPVTGDFP
jgi:hypothetical protein